MKTKTLHARTRKLPLVLLFFGACRSLSHDGVHPGGDDSVTVRGHLTASTTLAQAMEGKIVATASGPGYLISGSTPGEPSVGDDGSASYRVPIWVPDGVNGLAPSLAVEYNSEAGVGLLGPRWRLTGLSVISRCPKTRAQDGVQTYVNYFGTTFCMDGQRLTSYSSGPTSEEFRTERESYTRIVGTKDANGDIVTFKVHQRNGQIWHYGRTPSSRLHGNPMRFGFPPASDVSYAYYVDKIEDRYANSILITYANAVALPTSGVSQVQELEPDTITWGGTGETAGQRSVSFEYAPLPAGMTVDTRHMRWIHGLGIGGAQYLTRIVVRGPDGLGATPMLKQYVFGYAGQPVTRTGTPLITGDLVLAQISECDARVCKKSTRIEWEAGSFAYTRQPFNAPDVDLTGYKGPPLYPDGQGFDYAPQYRRLSAVDIDADGNDDIVYRAYVSPHHAGYYDCLGWAARAARFAPSDTSGIPYLEGATSLTALGSDPDPSCRAYLISSTEYQRVTAPNAYAGDIVFADLNGDGYPDVIAPIGKGGYDGGTNQYSYLAGYHAFMNTSGTVAPLRFGNPITFIDSVGQPPSLANFSSPKDATIAIGDIDGDGVPEVIQRRGASGPNPYFQAADLSGIGQVAKTETRNGYQFPYLECSSNDALCFKNVANAYFSDGTKATEHLGVIDLDGDGTVEILRSAPACVSGMNCGAMNGSAKVTSPTMIGEMPMPPAASTLGEARWFLDFNGDGLQDIAWVETQFNSGLYTAMNTGAGFGPPIDTRFSTNPGLAGSIMVVDFNLDGRQDLLLSVYGGLDMKVYLSDGAGGFSLMSVPIPSGRSDSFARQNVAADLNGDGLPDVVNLESSGLVGYIRQGKAPMLVTAVREGTGRAVEFGYDVSSTKDGSFYAVLRSQTCDTDRQRLECLNRGRWLTRSLTIGGTDAAPTVQTFAYRGGVSDKHGRGFLGFTRRDIYGPGSRHTTITYNPLFRSPKSIGLNSPYVYPYAMLPQTVRVDVDTPQGPNRHHYQIAKNWFSGGWQSNGTYLARAYEMDRYDNDCPSTSGGTCTGTARSLGSQTQGFTFDAYGNLTNLTTYYYDTTGAPIQTDSAVINYEAPNTNSWLLSLFDPTRPSTLTSTTVSPAKTVRRTIKLTSDPVTGDLRSAEVEPNGDASTRLVRSFSRDWRGRLQNIGETASGETRSTDLFHEDADGVYVSKTQRYTGSIVHTNRTWRHPGLGVVVEVDDQNGLAATRSYDTFGRLLSETGVSGASTEISYPFSDSSGVDLTIAPEGRATRAVQVHLDSHGRETLRISPIDASRVLRQDSIYDPFGRVSKKEVGSGPPGGPTSALNSYVFTYDDLDRVIYDCHLASDNVQHCANNAYDGLQVTATDEAGRVVTQIADALGRPSIQRAALQTGTSDTTFTYGPFDVLEGRMQSDNTGHTDMTYDVLGRQISLTRSDVGTRRMTYNSFGDIVGTSKQASDGTPAEALTYVRDGLGRTTSIQYSDGTYARFSWDAPAASPTTPAPYAIGKLVEVTHSTETVHNDYGANGLLWQQSWAISEYEQPNPAGTAQFIYDPQGRLSTLTYPSHGWGSPLSLVYAYDQYIGDESSITDVTNSTAPTLIWSASARNARGQITNESMSVGGGPTITRVTDYYLQNGLAKTKSLGGSNGQSQLAYTYDADGLPATLGMSGVGGSWTSGFTHDNLGRLTQWQPLLGTPVNFAYDSDGNLTQRAWSGETVYYGKTANARTVAVVQGGTTVRDDSYRIDEWGRMTATPVTSLQYDRLDRVTTVTESSGRVNFFRRDGFGNRLMTGWGNPDDGEGYGVLYTLGDLYEFRFSTTQGSEERCRVRAGGRLVGELVRTWDTSARTATFFLTDNVGSVVAEASSSGTVTARSRRDPFGNVMANAAAPYLPAEPNAADPDGSGRLGFGDHPLDRNWGLVDMVSRFYSPRLGRFISPDAILPDAFDRTEHNAFAYVRNSPAALQDPLGFCGEPEGEPCPITPIVPGSPSPPPMPPGDGIGPPPPCDAAHGCVQGGNYTPPKPVNLIVNRPSGAAMLGATSANAARIAGLKRALGAAEGNGFRIDLFPNGIWGSAPGGLINSPQITHTLTNFQFANGYASATLVIGTALGALPVIGAAYSALARAAVMRPGLVLAGTAIAAGEGGVVMGVQTGIRAGAAGGVNLTRAGLAHAADRHLVGGALTAGKSLFGVAEDLSSLAKAAEAVTPVVQRGGNLERIVDAGRTIGIDRATQQATSIYTVITNAVGDLVTMFPGRP